MRTAKWSVKVERILIVLAVSALSCVQSPSSRASIITVANTADSGSGSLRAALATAANGDTIDASSITGTILLTSGELVVSNSLIVIGPGSGTLRVNGNFPNMTNRVFHITNAVIVAMSGLTVTNGMPSSVNGSDRVGGGIFNDGSTLTVSNCAVVGNFGGGIRNKSGPGGATLIVADCTISGNTTAKGFGNGAGIGNDGSSGLATLLVLNTTINGNNQASGEGGGISCSAGFPGTSIVSIVNSTLSGNSASYGGAGIINSAGSGRATLVLSNCTVSGNSGDGIFIPLASGSGISTVSIGHTILNNGPGQNILRYAGTVTSLGYNLGSDSGGGYLTATGDQVYTDPKLGPLQDNGGSTKTHALLPGSPAIDAGDPSFTLPPNFDQRGSGFPRVVNGRIDIGAFEFTPSLLITAVDRIGDDLRLAFGVALLGENYEVQSRTNLSFGSWESLPASIPGNGSTAQVTVTNAFVAPQQFFRIHQLP
jgi:hypothetical protein